MSQHPIEQLWREVGLPEYFLGNGGSNHHLYALHTAIIERCAKAAERTAPIARGNFFAARRDQCTKIASAIRSLAIPPAGVGSPLTPSTPDASARAQRPPE
jgi:hypothetical protein